MADNKYQKHYDLLIAKARKRGGVEGYSETHHVLPRSTQGGDQQENLVVLTAREHLIAHLLLWKANPGNSSLLYAAMMMSNRFTINSRIYEALRKETVALPKSEETKAKMSAAALERPPEHIAKIAEANRGKKRSREARARMSRAGRNRLAEGRRNILKAARDPARRAKLSKAFKGKPGHKQTKETRRKISEGHKGKIPANATRISTCPHCGKVGKGPQMKRWHFDNCGKGVSKEYSQLQREKQLGRKHTEATRAKMSAAMTGWEPPRVECPHCGKSGGTNVMKRWHFDNCKQRK